ncbi:hypothetical protein BH23VER1_BH23VER1_31160 [soil metagenome]
MRPAPLNLPPPAARDLVLVGGGHSHALALRMMGRYGLPEHRQHARSRGARGGRYVFPY